MAHIQNTYSTKCVLDKTSPRQNGSILNVYTHNESFVVKFRYSTSFKELSMGPRKFLSTLTFVDTVKLADFLKMYTHVDFFHFELQYADIIRTYMFSYGDVLFRWRFVRFVTGDVLLRRRYVIETICMETFSAERFCMCAIYMIMELRYKIDLICMMWNKSGWRQGYLPASQQETEESKK
jgi:hypothetical protein